MDRDAGSSKEVTTGLFGPYLLSNYEIHHNLVGDEIGVYVLGFTGKDGVFYIDRVGRSEKNLLQTLRNSELLHGISRDQ